MPNKPLRALDVDEVVEWSNEAKKFLPLLAHVELEEDWSKWEVIVRNGLGKKPWRGNYIDVVSPAEEAFVLMVLHYHCCGAALKDVRLFIFSFCSFGFISVSRKSSH